MYDAIETLESKLAALQERNSKAEHKIKSLQEACCQAEEDNRCLHS